MQLPVITLLALVSGAAALGFGDACGCGEDCTMPSDPHSLSFVIVSGFCQPDASCGLKKPSEDACAAAKETSDMGLVGMIGPRWTWDETVEAPQGTKDMGTWTSAVYTPEQQARLGVDELGEALTPGLQALVTAESGGALVRGAVRGTRWAT